MMKLLRNPEWRRLVLLLCALGLAASAVAFLWEARFGVFVFALSSLFLSLFFLFTYRRYRKIAEMASDLDRILHGDDSVPIHRYHEGELAILQSEVYKMTVRLREQQQRLSDDKRTLVHALADISHQIRTPLTTMNLLVSFLSKEEMDSDRRSKITRDLNALLSRIEWLIGALLKISKLDAGTAPFNTETLPMEQFLQKAIAPLLIPIELREQHLSLRAFGSFSGDIAWTGEAVGNIVKNCMEHTPTGGTIDISAAENTLFSEIVISDSGPGIAPEDLPHIFERFYKGKNSDKDSFGIGLALARMIVLSQNGTIKAENIAPHGAKFTLRFYKSTV